jgi:hypothetical protein
MDCSNGARRPNAVVGNPQNSRNRYTPAEHVLPQGKLVQLDTATVRDLTQSSTVAATTYQAQRWAPTWSTFACAFDKGS